MKCEGSNELDGQVKLLENTMTYNVEGEYFQCQGHACIYIYIYTLYT